MRANGDKRDIGEIRSLHRQGVDVRASSPAYNGQEPTTTIKSNAPAEPKPATSAQSSGSGSLTEHQKAVLQSVMGNQGGNQAQISAPRPQTNPQGGDFMTMVDAHQKANGCKRSESIGAVAEDNPELHRQWLQAQQPSGPAPDAQTPQQKASEHSFWTEARQYSAQHGVSMSHALSELAKQKPEAHAQFLQDVQ